MYLIIDITTEFTTISLFKSFDFNSRIKFTKYPTIYNYELATKELKERIEKLIEKFGYPKETAISITGTMDYKTNIVVGSAYLYDYNNKNLAGFVQSLTNSRVYIDQDCVCDAYAELGNLGKDIDNYGLITVTYGIGGVFIRKVKKDLFVFPTELGHTIIIPQGRLCSCGQRGCVEAYIGGEHLKDRFLKPVEEIKDIQIWEQAVDYLAIAVTNFLMCYPTKNIIFSGNSISTVPFLKNKIKGQLAARMKMFDQPKVRISSLSNKANTYGALKLIELNNSDINLIMVS